MEIKLLANAGRKLTPTPGSSVEPEILEGEAPFRTLMSVLDVMDRAGSHRVVVSGFGRRNWPLDLGYDFAMVLEELPHILQRVAHRRDFSLPFWGQGLETEIKCTPLERDRYALVPTSCGELGLRMERETIEASELQGMLMAVLREFLRVVVEVQPCAFGDTDFVSWLLDLSPERDDEA